MMNPYGAQGGKQKSADRVRPSEAETVVINVALWLRMCRAGAGPMQIANLRESVSRLLHTSGYTNQLWPTEPIRRDVLMLCTHEIPQKTLHEIFQLHFAPLRHSPSRQERDAERQQLSFQLVQVSIFSALVFRCDSVHSFDDVMNVLVQANLDNVLSSPQFGGYSDWSTETFFNFEVWGELGSTREGLCAYVCPSPSSPIHVPHLPSFIDCCPLFR